MNPISPSMLIKYDLCPRQCQAMYITKELPYESNIYTERGDTLHKAMANAILDGWKDENWPEEQTFNRAKALVEDARALRDKEGFFIEVERRVAINRQGQIVNWFDKSAEFRCIVDFWAKRKDCTVIIDWKTGKTPGHPLQLHLNGWCLRPEIKNDIVIGHFVYLDKESDDDGGRQAYMFHVEECSPWGRPEIPENLSSSSMVNTNKIIWEYKFSRDSNEFKPKKNDYCKYCKLECELKE